MGLYWGLTSSKSDGTFGPKDNITRAEFCQILYDIHWTVPKSDIAAESREWYAAD